MTIAEALQIALQHHQAGRLAEAEAIYRQILAAEPRHADALHLLGVIALQVGRNDVAAQLIGQAIALAPQSPAFHSNLGEAQRKLGRLDEAVASYRRALQLQPDYAEAHSNLGVALAALGRLDDAIDAFRSVVQLKPDFAEAHSNLGGALSEKGRLDEAVKCFRRAIELKPGYTDAHYNLGNALKDLGILDDAIATYRRALDLKPDYAEAHNNLGNVLSNKGRFAEAESEFRTAIRLSPEFREAWSNLAGAHKDQGRLDEAIAAYRHALELRPDCATVHSNLLVSLHYSPEMDEVAVYREHCRFDEIHARPLARFIEPHANDPAPSRRLRIGYVSPDFREHSVAFFLEGLFASHDRGEVEIFCYADRRDADRFTDRLRQHAGSWREIAGASDAEVAAMIRRDGIDILVDLAGHMAGNRLTVFARKPAPVQVTWLGCCDTTGMKAMDYRFTDAHADPPGTTEHLHAEKLIRLPETFACFRPSEDSPPVGPLPAAARGCVTFGSFHTLAKLNDRLLESWAAILERVRQSRLMLVAAGLDESASQQRLAALFARHGIGPERLEFRPRQTLAQYLALHHEVDVMLDSHPFTGHTVSCHALWMGVPVVTLAGKTHCSRMVTSVLMNMRMPEWIARTPEEYVGIASALAEDMPRLAAVRAGLRERMAASPLTDAKRFARNVEQAYRQMWLAWCAEQPAHLTP